MAQFLWLLLSAAGLITCDCSSQEPKELKVRPGESVTLTCLNPKHTKPPAFMWSRPDMQSHGYVFFYRQSYSVDSFQHPSYCGRVELRDPEMKLGDVSVTLKNVTFNDTGTYQCKIIVSSRRKKRDTPEVISVVNLKVEDPGPDAGNTRGGGDKQGEEDGVSRGHVALIACLIPITAIVVLMVFYRRHMEKNESQPIPSENL
ncbi:myelin-oligodendrocyte glycoprotein isoform X2 [Lates calcarifer]|uniref:Myelin-oligodendrocyte glycoprotein isoform X2 n=1 Tax=Lates calcarifer TaxID=8187 RepID=A0AAJ7QJ51_LATCA|nr:myelin-oligodendrocyte glycoprotein isoform X2 [Lates calcarifer]